MYWTTYESNGVTPAGEVAFFRGQQISGKEIGPGVRVPACSGSGGGAGTTSSTTQARVYRADILKNFPLSTAEATLGKPVVNGTHQVRVADSGGGGSQSPSSGNQAIRAEGAVVVIVFQTTEAPLKAVVMYDGVYTVNQDSPVFSLNVGAYYDAADTSNAKLTTFVADGRNRPENLRINGNPIADTNPFRSAQGSAWDNPEFTVTGPVLDTGIPVEMTFPSSSIDCLTWAGVVAKVDVLDTDRDGIPDGVEDAATPLVEPPSRGHPNGVVQPDYHAMGASSTVPDVFVEFGFFTSGGWGGTSTVGAHDHRPDVSALDMVARAFKRVGMNAHFDVGVKSSSSPYPAGVNPLTTSSCANPATWTLACAIVPNAHARGGEFITEKTCAGLSTTCQFSSQKGVVGWKSGYNYFRDAWVQNNGNEFPDPQTENNCEQNGGCTRRRFDENRHDFVHYSLWAHALGLAKDPNRCLAPNVFDPVQNRCEDASGNLVADNPAFHITGTHSGFGDRWGGDTLIGLHGFGGVNHNGAPISQAGTFLHELAHNFGIGHAGETGSPNCKSNYVSSANYMFQVHGIPMLDALGQPVLGVDLSGQVLNELNEDDLADGVLTVQGGGPAMYATRWYAPAATSFVHNGLATQSGTKHCNGSSTSPTDGLWFASTVYVRRMRSTGSTTEM